MKITIIDLTESDEGVRRIPKNYRAVTGRVETLEGDTVEYESTLERDLVHLLDFNARVAKVVSQPLKIRYRVDGGEIRSYTPDFLARYRAVGDSKPWRPALFEVKYREELLDRREDLAPGFAAARMVCRSKGWKFRVLTERFIRNTYLENVQFLRNYRSYPDDGAKSLMLLRTMEQLKIATPSELLAATFMDLTNRMEAVGVMWRLITSRAIGANLTARLNMSSEIWHEEPVAYGLER
ncbi:MAG: TnsA endonuclease N-terminal domain-containing protein [Burkholderiales bacterium]|nr:TnsA endonuclease N-terminal domain-containing protein [Burkholderiales bacterium]